MRLGANRLTTARARPGLGRVAGIRVLPLVALLCALAGPSFAEFFTGEQLLEYLDHANISFSKRTIAMGYVSGVYDTVVGHEVCPKGEVSAKESMGIVHRYLEAHPESLGQPAAPLVVDALRAAFPCRD